MATLVNPILRVTDKVTGVPIPGAMIFFLSPGTSWPSGAKSAYTDLAMTQQAANPLSCDGDGYASGAGNGIFLNGPYQIVATSTDGSSAGYGSTIYFEIPNFQGVGNAGQFASVSSYTSLAAAVAAIGNTPTTLLIGTAQTLTGNLTVPSTLTLQFVQGGSIALGGFILTINSYFPRTGTTQWFTGTGSVVFGAGTLDYNADPAWFGGGSSGASAANSASINVIATLPASNATPDVSSLGGIYGTFKTNNSNATTITNFNNMVAGQKFNVIVEDANTSFGGALRGLPPSTPQYTTLQFLSDGTYAYCVGPPQGIVPAFRNRIINGEIRIDQRNASASQTISANANAALAYCVDRWFMIPQGASATGQQVSGPAGSQFKNMYQIGGASNITSILFAQRIESINIVDLGDSGATVSLSAYLATTASNTTIAWAALTPGSLDTWAANGTGTTLANGTWSANSNLTRYTASFPVNANAANGLQIGFSVANLTSGVFQITGVQLESGVTVTPFERRPDQIELGLCQRYAYAIRAANLAPVSIGMGQVTTTGTTAGTADILVPLPVPLRAPANATLLVPANVQVAVTTSNGSVTAVSQATLNGNGTFGNNPTEMYIQMSNAANTITAGQATRALFGGVNPGVMLFLNEL